MDFLVFEPRKIAQAFADYCDQVADKRRLVYEPYMGWFKLWLDEDWTPVADKEPEYIHSRQLRADVWNWLASQRLYKIYTSTTIDPTPKIVDDVLDALQAVVVLNESIAADDELFQNTRKRLAAAKKSYEAGSR